MINIERIKELACEGDRFFYLQAVKADIGPGDRDSTYLNQAIAFPYTGFYWKIPLKESNFFEN
jgi:hypothetical protein